jgi:hypothetical protein
VTTAASEVQAAQRGGRSRDPDECVDVVNQTNKRLELTGSGVGTLVLPPLAQRRIPKREADAYPLE